MAAFTERLYCQNLLVLGEKLILEHSAHVTIFDVELEEIARSHALQGLLFSST